jgi:hypothetical protein
VKGNVMVEAAGKAVHRERAKVLKPGARKGKANQRVNLTL